MIDTGVSPSRKNRTGRPQIVSNGGNVIRDRPQPLQTIGFECRQLHKTLLSRAHPCFLVPGPSSLTHPVVTEVQSIRTPRSAGEPHQEGPCNTHILMTSIHVYVVAAVPGSATGLLSASGPLAAPSCKLPSSGCAGNGPLTTWPSNNPRYLAQ